jgi:hypothetical protein
MLINKLLSNELMPGKKTEEKTILLEESNEVDT